MRRVVPVFAVVLAACGAGPGGPAADVQAAAPDAMAATADPGVPADVPAVEAVPDPGPGDGPAASDPGDPDVPGDAAAPDPDAGTGTDEVPVAPACTPGHRILEAEVANARDLGGVPLAGGLRTACGAIYRGAALTGLSEAGCAAFADTGIRTVVDLRTATERAAAPESACIPALARYVEAPLPTPWSVSPAEYVADLQSYASMGLVFDVLGDPEAYPVYVHCIYGRDRTGVVAAAVLSVLGASPEAILAEYQLTADAGLGAYPDSLQAVLDAIATGGGIGAWLDAVGVGAAQVDVLRAAAVAPGKGAP